MHHASGHVPPSVHSTKQARVRRRAACTAMYSYPSSASSVPVLEEVVFRWDSKCYNFTKIDLYLSVQSLANGLVPVHCWTQIDFGMGATKVRLNPTWWNASSNGGDPIAAELGMTASGSPLWNTPASSSPAFTITNIYNASNTNAPAIASAPNGSSTAGSSHPESLNGGIAGGRLAAAVATPLVALIVAVCAFLAWHRFYRKGGDTKRWSAVSSPSRLALDYWPRLAHSLWNDVQVIDKRVSMMSEGTWQPSASIVSRPESFTSRNRYSTSSYGNLEGAQRSSFIRPSSTYLSKHTSSPRRPVDRSSRISFASIPELSCHERYDKLPAQSHHHGRTRSDMGPLCTRRDLTQMSSSPSAGALSPRSTGMSAYKSSLRHEVLLSDPITVKSSEEDSPPSGPVKSLAEDPTDSISSESDDSTDSIPKLTEKLALALERPRPKQSTKSIDIPAGL